MNFFEHQDSARRRTALLVCLFVAAVIVIVIVTNAAIFGILAVTGWDVTPDASSPQDAVLPFLVVGAVVVLLIGISSTTKAISLRRGGGTVAEMLGGRLVSNTTDHPDERRLMNVVEEMAIASGTPVPLVYVLDAESGINAFAAGHGPEDAAVAVTRGALEQFTRDELQGVMAHEFSHILNNDVRLNTRLAGILFGILVLAITGRLILRSGGGRSSRSNDKGGSAAILLIGLALMIIGYVGVFFGRLIKQAVSRQREFLADASAVQFTRNPQGLADALKRIGQWSDGSAIASPAAEEVSHFFFADGMTKSLLGSLLSTHPPLVERIRRLDPTFTGTPVAEGPAGQPVMDSGLPAVGVAALASHDHVDTSPTSVTEAAGTAPPDNFVYDDLMEVEIPAELRSRLDSGFGAVAVICALVLDDDRARRAAQLQVIAGGLGTAVAEEATSSYVAVTAMDRFAVLPLVDMAMPPLRGLSERQAQQLMDALEALIASDRHLSLREYAIRSIVRNRLNRDHGHQDRTHAHPSRRQLSADVTTVTSGLARSGHSTRQAVNAAYEAARVRLLPEIVAGPVPTAPTALEIDAAVTRLSHLPAHRKRSVVDACAHSVLSDSQVTLEEAELLRVVIVALGVPLPPFLPRVAGDSTVG